MIEASLLASTASPSIKQSSTNVKYPQTTLTKDKNVTMVKKYDPCEYEHELAIAMKPIKM